MENLIIIWLFAGYVFTGLLFMFALGELDKRHRSEFEKDTPQVAVAIALLWPFWLGILAGHALLHLPLACYFNDHQLLIPKEFRQKDK